MIHWTGDLCNVSALSRAARRPDAARQTWCLVPPRSIAIRDPNPILSWAESLNQARHAIDERVRDADWVVLRFPVLSIRMGSPLPKRLRRPFAPGQCCDRTSAGGRRGWAWRCLPSAVVPKSMGLEVDSAIRGPIRRPRPKQWLHEVL